MATLLRGVGNCYVEHAALKRNICLALLVLLGPSGFAWANLRVDRRIVASRTTLEAGEPLALKLIYRDRDKTERDWPFPRWPRFTVSPIEDTSAKPYIHRTWRENIREGSQPGEYACNVLLWIEAKDIEKQGVEYIFSNPGRFKVSHLDEHEKPVASIEIEIAPASRETQKALAFLSDPNNLVLLLAESPNVKDKPHRMAQFENMVAQCGNTLLGQMMAARLGIEYFRQMERGTAPVKLRAKQEKTGQPHPLLVKAHDYLTMGARLPDEFVIREEVLKDLSIVKWIAGKDEQTDALLDELVTKYPNTRCGKEAARAKTELETLRTH